MPFQSNDQYTESKLAGANLSDHQFRFVKLNADGRVIKCDTLGERAYGVLLNKPLAAGDTAQVVSGPGGSEVEAGAAIAAIGSELTTDATGRAIPATVDKHYVNAISKSKAAAAGNTVGANLRTYQKNV